VAVIEIGEDLSEALVVDPQPLAKFDACEGPRDRSKQVEEPVGEGGGEGWYGRIEVTRVEDLEMGL
jgi:hypothetical protein